MRRLRALIAGLPQTSAVARLHGWSTPEELSALTVEALYEVRRTLIMLWSSGTPPDPLRLPRPNDAEDDDDAVSFATGDEMRMFFQGG